MPAPRTAATRLVPLAVALLVLLVQLPFFDRWWSHMDEGHVLLFADLIAQGGDLYRDATLYPLPGAFYGLAQAFKLFGTSIGVSRWIVAVEFALFAALVFVWVRGMVGAGFAWGAVGALLFYRVWAFPHWQVYSYSTTSLLLIAGAAHCLLRYLAPRDAPGPRAWLLGAGLLFGLAVYCKQDYGAAALLSMTTLLGVAARSRGASPLPALLGFVGAGAAVGAVVGLYFLAQGILPDLIQQTVLNHVRGIATYDYTTYPPLWPLFAQEPALRSLAGLFAFFPGIVTTVDLEGLRQDPIFQHTFLYDVALKLYYWLPYGLAAVAGWRLWRRREALAGASEAREAWLAELLLVLLAATFLLLLTVNRPQDYLHLAVLTWPFLVLGVVWAGQSLPGRPVLAVVVALLLAVPGVPLLGYSGRALWRLHSLHDEPVDLPRAGIRARPSEARLLEEVTAWMQARSAPEETVAVLPYFPMLSFLADRKGPHRSAYIVWPFPEFEDRDARIVRALEAHATQSVVYNISQFPNFDWMQDFAPELFAHLVENFEMVESWSQDTSGYKLVGLVRETPRPDGVSLLDAVGDDGGLWLETPAGPPRPVPPHARPGRIARQLWPFRPALAMRPGADGERSVYALPWRAEAGQRLETAVSVSPHRWFAAPAWHVDFELAVVDEAGARHVLFARRLDPHRETADRRWHPVAVPLDAFAGQVVHVELVAAVSDPAGEELLAAGWAEPRIVSSPPAPAAARRAAVAD